MSKINFVEELKWRGMINNIMPGTEEQLNKEMTSGYVGIDPTASSTCSVPGTGPSRSSAEPRA